MKLSPMTWTHCWICSTQSEHYHYEKKIPDGWRRARRGFAGMVSICPRCIKNKWNYQKDYHSPAFTEYSCHDNVHYFYYARVCVATIYHDEYAMDGFTSMKDFPWILCCDYSHGDYMPNYNKREYYNTYAAAKTRLRNLLDIRDRDIWVTTEFNGKKI